MNEEEWREQRVAELREKMEKQQSEEENRHQMARQLDAILNTLLTPEAKTRLTNVRLVDNEKYLQVAQALVVMARQGKIMGKITDEQLKQLLLQLTPTKKGFSIKRK